MNRTSVTEAVINTSSIPYLGKVKCLKLVLIFSIRRESVDFLDHIFHFDLSSCCFTRSLPFDGYIVPRPSRL